MSYVKVLFIMCFLLLAVIICLVCGCVTKDPNLKPTCEGNNYPPECYCIQERTFCDCSNRTWTFVHKGIPKQLEQLNLEYNLLKNLSKDSFSGCYDFVYLDVSSNNLNTIGEGTFDKMPKLRRLLLANNFLKFSDPRSVPKYMLQYNTELTKLDICNNLWYKEKGYNSHLFSTLNKLIFLYMDGIDGAVFGKHFQNLTNLHLLYLTGGIKSITNDTFRNIYELRKLHSIAFIGGELNHIDVFGLSYFQSVKKLDVSGNKKLSLNGFLGAVRGIANTPINILYIYNIEADDIVINDTFYAQLKTLKDLQLLDLSQNNIVHIDFNDICKYIPNLKTLKLESNKINRVDSLYFPGLSECEKCININAQHQSNKTAVEHFSRGDIVLPPNVQVISLNDAFKISSIGPIDIEGGTQLERVDLRYNGISRIQGPIELLDQCDPSKSPGFTLDLQGNTINYISYTSFTISVSRCIKTLNLADNKLGEYISQLKARFFKNYDNLETLDLSRNAIAYTQPDLFEILHSLKNLYLSGNNLKSLFSMAGFSPKYINLAENDFNYLIKEDCTALNEAKLRETLRVDLYKNPLICTCESYPFLQWLNTTNVNVTRWENNSKCGKQYLNRDTLSIVVLPHLFTHCHIKIWIIFGGSALLGILIVSLLFVCLYRKRWCLKYWCIKAVRNQKRHQLLREHQARDLYQYDVFVMYSADDSAWVANQLVPNLESPDVTDDGFDNALKLCIHQRDFLGGVDISENIVQAIDSSFKCLVILSRNFCQSEWTNFEIQMARSRSNAEGRNVIIVVRLEDVPLREMSTSLIYILQNHTYIDYPANEESLPRFWDKVKNAIKDSC